MDVDVTGSVRGDEVEGTSSILNLRDVTTQTYSALFIRCEFRSWDAMFDAVTANHFPSLVSTLQVQRELF